MMGDSMSGGNNVPLGNLLDPMLLATNIQQALRVTAFYNSMTISPRRTNETGQILTAAFSRYYEWPDDKEVQAHGRSLALEGLGPRSILAATEALRRMCYEHSNPVQEVSQTAGAFCSALLEGYIFGREEILLETQERTHRAYLAALLRQSGETNPGS